MGSLSELRVGQSAVIERLGGERTFRRRLMELGLVPGTRVELVGIAPLGDPLKLIVRGCVLSIRRAEASHVLVAAAADSAAESLAGATSVAPARVA
jgi:Fe2+ transport system protein FeoA